MTSGSQARTHGRPRISCLGDRPHSDLDRGDSKLLPLHSAKAMGGGDSLNQLAETAAASIVVKYSLGSRTATTPVRT